MIEPLSQTFKVTLGWGLLTCIVLYGWVNQYLIFGDGETERVPLIPTSTIVDPMRIVDQKYATIPIQDKKKYVNVWISNLVLGTDIGIKDISSQTRNHLTGAGTFAENISTFKILSEQLENSSQTEHTITGKPLLSSDEVNQEIQIRIYCIHYIIEKREIVQKILPSHRTYYKSLTKSRFLECLETIRNDGVAKPEIEAFIKKFKATIGK